MKTGYKITITIILILIIIGISFFSILPLVKNNAALVLKITENSRQKIDFENNIKSLLEIKSRYYILNAQLEKYNTQIPLNGNIPNLTDQIYEIEKYSGAKIGTISFKDDNLQDKNNEENSIGDILVNLNITGSYYQILTFINTLEIMPRFIRIENFSIELYQETESTIIDSGEESNQIILNFLITFRAFYDKTNYQNG